MRFADAPSSYMQCRIHALHDLALVPETHLGRFMPPRVQLYVHYAVRSGLLGLGTGTLVRP